MASRRGGPPRLRPGNRPGRLPGRFRCFARSPFSDLRSPFSVLRSPLSALRSPLTALPLSAVPLTARPLRAHPQTVAALVLPQPPVPRHTPLTRTVRHTTDRARATPDSVQNLADLLTTI